MRILGWRRAAASGLVLAIACSKAESPPVTAARPDSGVNPGNVGDGGGTTTTDGSSGPVSFVDVTQETQSYGGQTRLYFLAKPKNYDAAKSYPLVLSFHGNPGTAEGQATFLPFDSVSQDEAIIAYPQALTGDWDLYTATKTNVDMNWINQLPTEIKKKVAFDAKRIYGFGYSGGGFFLTQFTCRFTGPFKAVSVNAGGGPDEPQMGFQKRDDGCYICPGGPIPMIVTHGDADTEVDPASGEFTKNCVAETNGCDSTESPTDPSPCTTFDGCPTKDPVKWCLIPGQSHLPWANAMKEAWAFFSALP